jgi:hypothetical protein
VGPSVKHCRVPDVSSFEGVQVGKTGRADEELPPAKRMRATAAAK